MIKDKEIRACVSAEKLELDEKLEKLREFIYSRKLDALPLKQQRLLQLQEHAMTTYSAVLGERLS
jgi:hypothetical protein